MAWSRGPGSENIFFAGFWAQNDQFWGRNKFQNAKQFRISKAKTSSAVCLEFAETLFFNPFFETAGALEFLSATPIFALLWHPQTSSHLFLAFFGVLKRRPLVAPARGVGRATRVAEPWRCPTSRCPTSCCLLIEDRAH
jgi:hypothetical protein